MEEPSLEEGNKILQILDTGLAADTLGIVSTLLVYSQVNRNKTFY